MIQKQLFQQGWGGEKYKEITHSLLSHTDVAILNLFRI